MARSLANSRGETASLITRRDRTHLEPFNGSDIMMAIRGFVAEQQDDASHQAILTLRAASDSDWTRAITIQRSVVKNHVEK